MSRTAQAHGLRDGEPADQQRDLASVHWHLRPRDAGRVAAVWAVWSLSVLALAALAAALPNVRPSAWDPEMTRRAPSLFRWDSGWYASVATQGYRYDPAAAANNIRFYPLYPLTTRALSGLLRAELFRVGIGFSLACLLAALLLFSDLAAQRGGPEALIPGLGALLVFPTAFYFASFYSESLFLLTTVAAFWAARRGSWSLAGIAGAAASLTRLNGIVIVLPIAWLAWQDAGRMWRSLRASHLFAVATTLGGAAAYPAYLWVRFGSPWIYFRNANTGWAHRPTPIWGLLVNIWKELIWRVRTGASFSESLNFWIGLSSLLLFTVLTVVLFRRRQFAEGLFVAGNLLVLMNSGSIDALHRYVLALFPCFLLLGDLLRTRSVLGFLYFFCSVALLVTLLTRFVNWIWVA